MEHYEKEFAKAVVNALNLLLDSQEFPWHDREDARRMLNDTLEDMLVRDHDRRLEEKEMKERMS